MLLRIGFALSCVTFVTSAATAQNAMEAPASRLEARLIQVLGDGQAEPIDAVAKDVLGLKNDERRALPFRVRPNAVEFRFQGEYPGHRSVEFIVSNKNRDYESLLVLNKTDLERTGRLWKAVQQLAKAGKTPVVEFKLLFVDKGQARVEDLQNVFSKVDFKTQKNYYVRLLSWEEDGLRIRDPDLDPATVPPAAQKAAVIVIVRPAFLLP